MSESSDTTTESQTADTSGGTEDVSEAPSVREGPEAGGSGRGSKEREGDPGDGPASAGNDAAGSPHDQAQDDETHQEVERLEEELAALNDRHLRLAAEFDNFRRRSQSQLGETGTRAQAALVSTLVDILDDFERVTSLDPEQATVESVLEGVKLVEQKLHRALEEAGLEPIEAEAAPFDPNTMEAMMKEPTDAEEEDETVARVLQRGFRFKGHLVRPARVSVRKYD